MPQEIASVQGYPSGADVQTFLLGTGLTVSSNIDFDWASAKAVAEWEQRTGWRPFLSKVRDQSSQRLFDPPGYQIPSGRFGSYRGGRNLDLGAGIVEAATCIVQIGYVPGSAPEQPPVSAGVALIQGIQYYLRPNSSEFLVPPLPYTEIEFLSSISGIPQSISVWAKWGFTANLTSDVWDSIVERSAAILAPQISLGISGGRVSAKTVDIAYEFADGSTPFPVGKQMQVWNANFARAVSAYRRVVV